MELAIKMNINTKTILLKIVLLLVSQVSLAVNEQLISLSGLDVSPPSVVAKIWVEPLDRQYTDFPNLGVATPQKALVTFFNLSREDKKEELINIHYQADGTQDYIRRLLTETPDAFLGAVDLKSIHLSELIYWGENRQLNFEIENINGQKAVWSENYTCSGGTCLKSNYDMFSQDASRSLFLGVAYSLQENIEENISLEDYISFELYPEDQGVTKSYPMTLYILPRPLEGEKGGVTWVASIHDFMGALNLSQEKKKKSLISFFSDNYNNWGEVDKFRLGFDNIKFEKDDQVKTISSYRNIEYKFFIENDKFVWNVFSGDAEFANEKTGFILIYDKEHQSFVVDAYRDYASARLDLLLRKSLVARAILQKDEELSNLSVSWPSINEKENDFSEQRLAILIALMIFALVVIVVWLNIKYFFKRKI